MVSPHSAVSSPFPSLSCHHPSVKLKPPQPPFHPRAPRATVPTGNATNITCSYLLWHRCKRREQRCVLMLHCNDARTCATSHDSQTLDITIEYMTIMLHIQEVLGSGLSPTIIYPELYRGFHQSFKKRPLTLKDLVNKSLSKFNPIHISTPKYFHISFNIILYRGLVLGLTESSDSSDFRSQFCLNNVLIRSFISQ